MPQDPTFTKTGYTFAHWNTLADGTGTSYSDGASYPFTASATLYAQWAATTDTITFNSEGGSSATAMSGTDGTTITLPSAPTYAGHTFNGWFAATTGGTTSTSPYMLAGTTTLYAQWSANAGGTWGTAAPTTFATGVQSTAPNDVFNSVACTSAGNCVAVGSFVDVSGNQEAFTVSETNGTLGTAAPTTFATGVQSTTPNDVFNSVACTSAGNCVAVGSFVDVSGNREAFTVSETNGTWGTAAPTTFATGVQNTTPNGYFKSVACASAGNCVAVGQFLDASGNFESFTLSETNGTWGTAAPTTFATGVQSTTPNAGLFSVACPSDGNCVAVGQFLDASGIFESFTLNETGGTWGTAAPTTFATGVQSTTPADFFNSVACTSAGNCVAVGQFLNASGNFESFTLNETGGTWGTAAPTTFATGVQSTTPNAGLFSVACPSDGNCVAVGQFIDASGNNESFTLNETGGTWGTAAPTTFATGVQSTTPNDVFNSVACASDGNCVAVGVFRDTATNRESFTLNETNGTWGTAAPTTFATGVQSTSPSDSLYSVACASDGNCVAVGVFQDTAGSAESFTLGVNLVLSHTVAFNNNTGSGAMSNETGSAATALTTNAFTKTGHTFTGWNTAANGSGTPYTDGARYSFAASITLYAQWTVVIVVPTPPLHIPPTGPTNALPPSNLPSSDYGTPTSASASSTTAVQISQSSGTTSETIGVPAGALPSGTTVSVYPITESSTLATSVPTGQTYLSAFSISWQAPDGTSPMALSPVAVTVGDLNLVVGAMVLEVTPAGQIVVATVTSSDVTAGSITFNIKSDPTFIITQPTHLRAQATLIVTSLSGRVGTSLTLAASGGSGTGAVMFTVTNGTATRCTLSGGVLSAATAGTCRVTATKAADNTYLAASSIVTAVVMLMPPRPSAVSINFESTSARLSTNAKTSLTELAKKLLVGASVRVIGYATDNATLATKRARAVVRYLLHKIDVIATTAVTTRSKMNNGVVVETVRQASRVPAVHRADAKCNNTTAR